MAKGDKKRALRGRAGRMQGGRGSGRASSGQVRLWGRHAVEAADVVTPELAGRVRAGAEKAAQAYGDFADTLPSAGPAAFVHYLSQLQIPRDSRTPTAAASSTARCASASAPETRFGPPGLPPPPPRIPPPDATASILLMASL